MPPPFILQQQLFPHFNRISQRASLASSPWQFLCRLVRLQARCSPTRPRQLFSTLPPANTISSPFHPIKNTWQISGQRSALETRRVQKYQKKYQQQLYFFLPSSCRWCTQQLIIALLIRLVPLHISATSQSSSGTSVPNSTKQEAH